MRTVDPKAVAAARGLTERSACRILADLARKVPGDQAIVELGAYQGRTTGWLALGASKGESPRITSIDPWDTIDPDTVPDGYPDLEPGYRNGNYVAALEAWCAHATNAGLWGRAVPLRGASADLARFWVQPIGLLYHDALHTADGVENDLRAWTPHVAPGGAVALHDAGNPKLGVIEGAARVLDAPGWRWDARELRRWKKDPNRRGLLVVRRA